MTDTSNKAPERIWAFHAGPMVGLFIGQREVGTNICEYVRKDIVNAENGRLREALRAIAGVSPWPDPDMGFNDLARAALNPEGG